MLPAVMDRTKVISLASESLTRMTLLNLTQYVKIQGVGTTLGTQTQKNDVLCLLPGFKLRVRIIFNLTYLLIEYSLCP